jgi:hypothetical protein
MKLQTPSAELQRISKNQAPKNCVHADFGIWDLDVLWSLGLGRSELKGRGETP